MLNQAFQNFRADEGCSEYWQVVTDCWRVVENLVCLSTSIHKKCIDQVSPWIVSLWEVGFSGMACSV